MRIAFAVLAAVLFCHSSTAWAGGKDAYEAQCARCHGADGTADTPVGKAMKTPALAGTAPSLEAVTASVEENSKHSSLKGKVSDEDLAAITEYLATLGGE